MKKTCRQCGATKGLDGFYKQKSSRDGLCSKCKECTKANVRLNRRKNIDYYRMYDKMRKPTKSNRIPSILSSNAAYRLRNPKKVVAYGMVAFAIKNGKLKRLPCEVCGDTNVHAHHDDYDKPLEVRWLCSVHHREIHKKAAA